MSILIRIWPYIVLVAGVDMAYSALSHWLGGAGQGKLLLTCAILGATALSWTTTALITFRDVTAASRLTKSTVWVMVVTSVAASIAFNVADARFTSSPAFPLVHFATGVWVAGSCMWIGIGGLYLERGSTEQVA